MANKRVTTPEGWQIIGTQTGARGDFVVWRDNDGFEIALKPRQVPDTATLDLLAINGIEPKAPGELTDINGDPLSETVEEDEAPETAVDRILATFGKMDRTAERPGEVRVYRLPTSPGGPEMYCAKFTPDDFERDDLDPIARTYGAGTYRIRVMGATPRFDAMGAPIKHGGKFVRLLDQVIEIGAPISDGSGAAPTHDPVSRALVESMQRMQTQLMELAQSKNTQPNLLEQIMLLKELQGVMGGGGGGKQPGIMELAEQMRALKELSNEFGGGESEGGMMGSLKSLLPMIQAGLAAKANAPALPAPHVALPPSMQANPTPPRVQMQPQPQPRPTMEPEAAEEDMQVFQKLAVDAMVSALCKVASENGEVTEHAHHLAEILPDEMIDILDAPIWFGTLAHMYPEIEPHKEWFTKLREAIIARLDELSPGDEIPE